MDLPRIGPVFHYRSRESFVGVAAVDVVSSSNRAAYGEIPETTGLVLLPDGGVEEGKRFLGVPDDNRSAILPDVVTLVAGRGYAVSVKGVGARTPLYGSTPLDFVFDSDFGAPARAPGQTKLATARMMTAESWFGESPYGAQGVVPGSHAISVTQLAEGCSINGFHICPVLALSEIPADPIRRASSKFWYRRHRGKFFQEQRLVPSNIRLYHQSETTLGQHPNQVLRIFGIESREGLDAFVDRFIASGVAALTVFVRTMRRCPGGVEGLNYENVWLDKDCIVAPDGTLHFADLEGLDWVVAGREKSFEDRVREQFDRNFYEFMYGVDVLARESERFAGRSPTQAERRAALVPRFELAVEGDSFVRAEVSSAGLDLIVKSQMGGFSDVTIPVMDLE